MSTQRNPPARRAALFLGLGIAIIGGAVVALFVTFGAGPGPTDNATNAAARVAGKCRLVTTTLGAPLGASWSDVHSDGPLSKIDGRLSGPKGSGTLHFEATQNATGWTLVRGFVAARGKVIDFVGCKELGQPAP